MKRVMITPFNKTALRLTTNMCENRNLRQRWIGRTGKEDDALMRGPPRSSDLTPCDFFFWGFVKDTPPLPANLQIFATVITAVVALVDRDMLTRVWNEMDCRIDVCRITNGYTWSSCEICKKKLGEFLSLSA